MKKFFYILILALVCVSCNKKLHTTQFSFNGHFDSYDGADISVTSEKGEETRNIEIWTPDEKTMCILTDANSKVSVIKIYHQTGKLAREFYQTKTEQTQDGVRIEIPAKHCFDEDGNEMGYFEFNNMYSEYIKNALKYFGSKVLDAGSYNKQIYDEYKNVINALNEYGTY